MPDPIQPVATQIQPPNPNQGIQALSGILGIQQQQQGLQLGQQQIAAGAANLQQTQERNRELSALAAGAKNALQDPAYLNADGTLNTTKFQRDMTALAPVYGPSMIGQITQNATGAIENRKALLALSNDQRQTVGNYLGAVAQDPNASSESFLDAVGKARGVSDDPNYQRMIDRTIMGAPKDSQGLRNFSRNLAVATGAPSAAASAPTMEPYNAPGNVLGLRQTNPGSPLGMGNLGGGVVQGATPAQQPGFQAQVAAQTTAAAGAGGVDNQTFGKVMAAGANSQRGLELAQKVEEDAKGVRTGQLSQDFANRLTIFQQHNPGATARQMLQKDAENLKSLAEEGATTNQEREQIGGGYPSPDTMGPDAIEKAARYWQGSFKMAGARRDNAVAHVQQNGTQGLALKDAAFMSNASPGKFAPPEPKKQMPSGAKLLAYAAAHFGGDTAKASAFLKQQGYE